VLSITKQLIALLNSTVTSGGMSAQNVSSVAMALEHVAALNQIAYEVSAPEWDADEVKLRSVPF
jgi:hypothetical protein